MVFSVSAVRCIYNKIYIRYCRNFLLQVCHCCLSTVSPGLGRVAIMEYNSLVMLGKVSPVEPIAYGGKGIGFHFYIKVAHEV